jgi:beta-N-acetylhexosaminidase
VPVSIGVTGTVCVTLPRRRPDLPERALESALENHMTESGLRRIGRHFLIGLQPSPSLTEHDRRLLRRLAPAGVIVFRENFALDQDYPEWVATFRRLLDDVRECIGRSEILVGIDHEGGRVIRPPAPVTHYEYPRQWADRSHDVGAAMGVELRSLGVNLNFAPVVDIDSNPSNPVIGPRAFGTTPEAVERAGVAFMKGMAREGVIACVKHFPGHGDTEADSHYSLPVLPLGLEQLRARELRPFRAAIDAGVRAVMTAHLLIPALDERYPATLSRPILHGVLRRELGFDGVVITDDIGMGATSELFRQTENAARALAAGCDLISLCSYWTDTERALDMAEAIDRAVGSGELPPEVLDASGRRVEALLRAAPQHDVTELPRSVFAAHAGLAPVRAPGESPAGEPGGTCTVAPEGP